MPAPSGLGPKAVTLTPRRIIQGPSRSAAACPPDHPPVPRSLGTVLQRRGDEFSLEVMAGHRPEGARVKSRCPAFHKRKFVVH